MNQETRKTYEIKEDFETKSTIISEEDVIFEENNYKVIIIQEKNKETFKFYFKPFRNREYYILIYKDFLEFDVLGACWVLKYEDYWSIADISKTSWYLTCEEKNDMLNVIRKNLIKIKANQIKIRKDSTYTVKHALDPIFNIDGIDYSISDASWRFLRDEGKVKLNKLGILEDIPGYNPFSIVKTSKGKKIYGPDKWPEYSDVQDIVEFSLEEYPSQFPYEEEFRFFWLKDSKKQVRGLAMIEKFYTCIYSFFLDEAVNKISFVRRVFWNEEEYTDIWRIDCKDGITKILLKSNKKNGKVVLLTNEELLGSSKN